MDEVDPDQPLSEISRSSFSYAAPGCSSLAVQTVLDQLAPSDNPTMLGRLGEYEILEVLGSGGMGVVLKGYDRSLNRYVAVKTLAPHLASSVAARKRFAREAKAAAGVVHQHVVAVHAVEGDAKLPYFVMQFVAGQSLGQRIDANAPMDLKDILRIGTQAADGLAAAHAQGLVHRDIKPSNILLENDVERVLLTDFGLARAVDDASMTRSGVVAGTPQFMSPEQARGNAVDPRSDLFSLGSVLYAMCTGHSPFRAESTMGVLRRISDEPHRPVRQVNPDIPQWLAEIIDRLLAKDPDQRFESATEVAETVGAWLAHVQQPDVVPPPERIGQPATLAGDQRSRSRVFKMLAGATFAFALLLAGIVIVLELDKGTLRIECAADGVPVRIIQGDKVIEKLTISKKGASVRVAAGKYVVEIDGDVDGIVVEDGIVELQRRGREVVRIVKADRRPLSKNIGNGIGVPIPEEMIGAGDGREGKVEVETLDDGNIVIRGKKKDVQRLAERMREAEERRTDGAKGTRKVPGTVGLPEPVGSHSVHAQPHFESPEAVLKYQEQCIQERNYFGYYDCLTQDELSRFSGLVLHILSSVTTLVEEIQKHQPSIIEASIEEELAKVKRVKTLLERSKLARPPQDALDAHERLVATTFARLRGDKSRENPEDFSDLLSKASGILKDRRQFLVEVVIACPEFFELLTVGGESPEWQVVVGTNRATATTSADQDHSVQIELRQLDGQWRISQMCGDDVIRAHISGAAMFGDEYAGATTEETPRTETNPGAEPLEPTPLVTEFHRQLAGRWLLKSCEEHGEQFTIEQLVKGDIPEETTESKKVIKEWKRFAVAVFDDKTFLFGSHPRQSQFEYSVDCEAEPMRITLTTHPRPRARGSGVDNEPLPKKITMRGLINVSENQLTIAIAGYGDDFPKDFESEGKDVLVLHYQRDRDAQVGPDAEGTSSPVTSTEAAEELERLQGIWKVLVLGGEGESEVFDEDDDVCVWIEDDIFSFRQDGDIDDMLWVRLDPTKDPKQIDLIFGEDAPVEGAAGIYALDEQRGQAGRDRLRICYGKQRPKKLLAGPKVAYMELERTERPVKLCETGQKAPGTVESPETFDSPSFYWPARISGYVTGANGAGIPAAVVKLTLTEQFREGTNHAERVLETVQTTADDDGKYTFKAADWPIPSAERSFVIDVLASAPEYAPWETGLYSRAGNHKAPDSLPYVILPRGKEITGRCIDAKGKPVFRAVILGRSACDPPSGHWQHRHGTTDLDGRFRVMVPDGHAAALWIVSDSEGNERIDIPATHDGPLQVKMRGGTSLVGRVESLSGEPVVGTLVVIQDIDRGVRDKTAMVIRFAAKTDEKGQFRMPPVRGEFRCFLAQASRSDERPDGESVFVERAAPPLAPVTVSLDGESRREEITLRESRTFRIGGAMRLEDGRPVEGCVIKVFCGGVSMGRPVSDKDGRYSITLPAMQQELSISALGVRNYHVRRAEHSPDEDHEDHFINLKGVTEDITNADFVFISRGENLEQPAEGSGSVLFWDLVGLGKKEEQPAGDAPKANESEEREAPEER